MSHGVKAGQIQDSLERCLSAGFGIPCVPLEELEVVASKNEIWGGKENQKMGNWILHHKKKIVDFAPFKCEKFNGSVSNEQNAVWLKLNVLFCWLK